MKALILAAGYAKRLWPMTKNKPKPLLEVKGKPIVEHIIKHFREIPEIDEIIIVTNNKVSLAFAQWVETVDWGLPIKLVNDLTETPEDRLGAVGDMKYAINELKVHDDLLVIAGDNLFEYKLKDFYDTFRKKKSTVVACLDLKDKNEVKEKFGVVELDKSNKIIGFEEKPVEPKSTLAATACYIFTKEDLGEIDRYIEAGNAPDNAGDFIKWLSNHKPVYAFVFTEKWFDIGSFENLGRAREQFNG